MLRKFFYGKDPKVENAFSKLEASASNTIKNIANLEMDSITSDDLLLLRQFIYYQGERTKGAAQEFQKFAALQIRPFIEAIGKQHGYSKEIIDSIELKLTSPQDMAIGAAASSMPAVMDLAMKILVAHKETSLILSDNPLVKYNQFAEHHPVFSKSPGSTGYALKGIQLFLPISPQVCICLYDPAVYQYGSLKNPFVRMSKKDVQHLNTLQAIYADKCLYWDSNTPPTLDSIDCFMKIAVEARLKNEPTSEEMPLTKRPDGKYSQLTMTHFSSVKINAKFSFAQVIDHNKYQGMAYVPPRSRELVEQIQQYGNLIEERRRERQNESK